MQKRHITPAWLLPALFFLLFAGLGDLLLAQWDHRTVQHEQQQARDHLELVNARLLQNLNATMHLASGIAAYIQANQGRIQESDILPWLKTLHSNNPLLRNIGLAPDNRITYLYPLAGNEGAVNLYLPSLQDQWPKIEAAIARREAVIDGPVRLVQGGLGIAYRLPVFLPDGRYWGIISTIINLDRLLQDIQDFAQGLGLVVELSFDAPSAESLGARHQAMLAFPMTGLDWRLAGSLREPTPPIGFNWHLLLWVSALLLAAICWVLIHRARQTQDLQASLTEHEALLKAAYESSPHGVAVLDVDGRILACNQRLCLLSQYSRQALLHSDLTLLWPDDSFRHLRQNLTPAGISNVVLMLQTASGQTVPVEIDMHHLRDAQAHWMVHIRNISERFQLQQIQSEFISTASHELRTPLTAVIGAIGLMDSGGLGQVPTAMQPLLKTANQSCRHMHKLISDLLDTNRLLHGTLQLDSERIDLAEQVHAAMATVMPSATSQTVQMDFQPSPDVFVEADALRVTQVVINLLGNAIRFSPPQSQIQIRLTPQTNRGMARISIRDQGPGIPDSFRQRIFQRFAQADSSDTRAVGGTGLGLFISKSLIEQMGGRMGYDSVPGQGATFWFELALADRPGG